MSESLRARASPSPSLCDAYGYTEALAHAIAEARKRRDPGEGGGGDPAKAEALQAIEEADGVLFGDPPSGDVLQPIGELLSALHPYQLKGKPCAAFGSYGWSGEAVGMITQRLEQLKAKTMEGFRVRLKPGEEDLAGAREFAANFARML